MIMQRIAFGILFSFFWSSAFVAGKYSIKYLEPLNFLSLRLGLSGAVLLLVTFAFRFFISNRGKDKISEDNSSKDVSKGNFIDDRIDTNSKNGNHLNERWQSLNLHEFINPYLWRDAIVLGLCNYVFYLGMSYTGLQYISPELAVLLVSTTPFVTSFVVSWVARSWSWLLWISIAFGFCGVFLVLSARMGGAGNLYQQMFSSGQSSELMTGVGWVSMAILAVSAGTLYFQFFAKKNTDKLYLVSIQNLSACFILFPFVDLALWAEVVFIPEFFISLVYQMIFVSMIAMLMWFKVIGWFGSGYASAFHLLNPIFATFLSVWLFDIQLTHWDVIGTLMVVVAMGIVSFDLINKR